MGLLVEVGSRMTAVEDIIAYKVVMHNVVKPETWADAFRPRFSETRFGEVLVRSVPSEEQMECAHGGFLRTGDAFLYSSRTVDVARDFMRKRMTAYIRDNIVLDICECKIPKGSLYYTDGDVYASSSMCVLRPSGMVGNKYMEVFSDSRRVSDSCIRTYMVARSYSRGKFWHPAWSFFSMGYAFGKVVCNPRHYVLSSVCDSGKGQVYIGDGFFHTCSSRDACVKYMKNNCMEFDEFLIYECDIPKGSVYYSDDSGNYASELIIVYSNC